MYLNKYIRINYPDVGDPMREADSRRTLLPIWAVLQRKVVDPRCRRFGCSDTTLRRPVHLACVARVIFQ